MITGQVTSRSEADIPITIYDVHGLLLSLHTTVDTGFSGFLTLPEATIELLRLAFERTETYTLGDDNDVEFDLYRARISWDGQDRDIFVLSTESDPLVGMSMLRGFGIYIDVVDGGIVRIGSLACIN